MLLVQRGTEGFVDDKAQRHIQHALDEGEGHIEHQQAIEQRVLGGNMGHAAQNFLVHADNGVQRQLEQHHIGGVDDEIVGGKTDQRHGRCAHQRADQRAFAALAALVDHTSGKHEHRAQNEVGQLAYTGAGAEGQVQQVLEQLNGHAVYGTEGEGAQQRRKVGDIQLDEGGHQRHGELDELEHGGYGGQHSGHGNVMGFLFLRHKKRLLFDGVTPLEAIVSQGARIKKEHYNNAVHAFSHPDYTVGTGIAPVHAHPQARSRTIPPVGNFAPPRRQVIQLCSRL